MIKTDVLIIGAGVTGLSCGWHLEKAGLFKAGKRKYILVEKENKIGGLAGSPQISCHLRDKLENSNI